VTNPTRPHPDLKDYYASAVDRAAFVDALFDGAARHYNLIGRMFDLGSGPTYRRRALRRVGLRPGMRLLDVAVGTGLLARGAATVLGTPGGVIGVDPSRGMLREARAVLSGRLVQGRAEALPFQHDLFDVLSMGFALRHVDDLEVTFREYRRVLKPGGRILLLEVSRPTSAALRYLLRVYLQRLLPMMARICTKSSPAELLMKYYWDTIDLCVPPETILECLRRAGFVDVRRWVFFGLISEYTAAKRLG
jgi:demethylmenaquinone methyltransferase/2-methoxy-6-polyprenyl-1,4-benzoquinol methylase